MEYLQDRIREQSKAFGLQLKHLVFAVIAHLQLFLDNLKFDRFGFELNATANQEAEGVLLP